MMKNELADGIEQCIEHGAVTPHLSPQDWRMVIMALRAAPGAVNCACNECKARGKDWPVNERGLRPCPFCKSLAVIESNDAPAGQGAAPGAEYPKYDLKCTVHEPLAAPEHDTGAEVESADVSTFLFNAGRIQRDSCTHGLRGHHARCIQCVIEHAEERIQFWRLNAVRLEHELYTQPAHGEREPVALARLIEIAKDSRYSTEFVGNCFRGSLPEFEQALAPAKQPDAESGQFYMQDSRSYVGNDCMFWAKAGGYTSDLSKAAMFSYQEAMAQHRVRDSDIPWPKAYMDGKTRPAVDFQYIDRVEALPAVPENRK